MKASKTVTEHLVNSTIPFHSIDFTSGLARVSTSSPLPLIIKINSTKGRRMGLSQEGRWHPKVLAANQKQHHVRRHSAHQTKTRLLLRKRTYADLFLKTGYPHTSFVFVKSPLQTLVAFLILMTTSNTSNVKMDLAMVNSTCIHELLLDQPTHSDGRQ